MKNPSRRNNSRVAILEAAFAVVDEAGPGNLSLDAVAKRAGVSKGGLLYNFPTKDSLLRGMMTWGIERARQAESRARAALGDVAGSFLKAYVSSTLATPEVLRPKSGAAVLAAIANNPELLDHLKEYFRRLPNELKRHAEADLAAIVCLATDGLFFLELLQVSPFGRKQRRRIIDALVRLAEIADTRSEQNPRARAENLRTSTAVSHRR
jgi:AcrR family transcriptional regulator